MKEKNSRKCLGFALLCLAMICLAVFPALAQSYTFRDAFITVMIPDDYIILTADNLDMHTEWLAAHQLEKEELIASWAESGTLLTAYDTAGDASVTIKAVQDEDAQTYFDTDQQSERTREAWRTAVMAGTEGITQGMKITTGEWDKTARYGRMLKLKYKLDTEEQTCRGLMYATVRNGYTVTVDYRVTGRTLKTADTNAMKTIMADFAFTEIQDKPADAVPKAIIETTPPAETDTGKFTIEGTCDTTLTVTGVAMRMSSSEKMVMTAVPDSKGRFKLNVALPSEGVWLVTMYVDSGSTTIQEEVFSPTTYKASLMPINFDNEVPSEVTGTDTLVISGTTLKGVKIQCMTGEKTNQTITTNGTGRFSFKVDVSEEGTYEIAIAFSKKGYDTRRFTYTVSRVRTQEDVNNEARANAIKPAYSTLLAKLNGYTGRIMHYNLHYVDKQQAADGSWVLKMAMSKTKRGYNNFVVVLTDEEPTFELNTLQVMYGECLGLETWQEEDGSALGYPGFRLLFWD